MPVEAALWLELDGAAVQPLVDMLIQVLRDAVRSGTVTVAAGECRCDALGWHPRMVWAETYDQAIADDTRHTASAPPGSTTAWRQGCRCMDCRDANTRRATARRGASRPWASARPAPLSRTPRTAAM